MNPGTDVYIRPMKASDLDGVVRLERLSFQEPWTREQFLVEMERGSFSRCRVAVLPEPGKKEVRGPGEERESIAGFIMGWLVMDELHITNIAVHPDKRRCGIAAALLEQALVEAVGTGAVWCQLEVRASNTPAKALYRSFGFQAVGRRKAYYRSGEDAVVMGKDLRS